MSQVKRKADRIFEVVKDMNIHSETTDDQLLKYTARQRSFFVYWAFMHKDPNMTLDSVIAQSESKTLNKLKTWRNEQKSNDIDLIMQTPSSENDNDEDDDSENEAVNSTQNYSEVSSRSQSPQPMDIDPQPIEKQPKVQVPCLDSNISDEVIKDMEVDTLRKVYGEYVSKLGTPIAEEILQLWKPNLLRSNITMHRNNIRNQNLDQTSSASTQKPTTTKGYLRKDPKYSNNSVQAKLDMTTYKTVLYDLSFLLPVELKGTEGLRSYFSDTFQTLQGYCNELKLVPWDESKGQQETIENIDDLPSSITQIKKYLFNARAPVPGARSYFSIHLSFPIRANQSTFNADVTAWSQANNIRFTECSVQHADVRSVGWLAYAPNSLNSTKWCTAVQDLFQIYYKKKNVEPLMIGLTWRPMNGQYGIESKKKVYAMHVNTPRHNGALTKKFLRILAHNKKWPLGVRFRLVDEYHEYMSEPTKIKYRYMFDRHRTFTKEMKQISNDEVINVDKRIGDSKMTVRDVVNNIRDISDNKRPRKHGIYGK